ncbi:c-type cytochrome [Dyella japonica]|uniref:Cytochrome c553 n=1 Tax=Dyella japonica TaxID=231455 RepID=A0ABV2JP81_9GAMM
MSSNRRRNFGQLHVAIVAFFMSSLALAQMSTQGEKKAVQLANQDCARCHGVSGDSPFPWVPRLAAQRASYLKAEILDFRTHERSELLARDIMQGRAANIDDETAASLAGYYARQPPAPGTPGDPERVARGRALFEQSNESRGACMTCHGQHAEGVGIFPRLAGQHAVYLQYQLRVKQHDRRRTSVMHGMISELSPEDMIDLAVYLQSIP